MADYALLDDSETAVIEMALASGLELLGRDQLDPLRASTYGTGTLLQAALDAGAKRIIVGMGGSATVDGGVGCLQALGVRLLGVDAPVGGGGLHKIHTIDVSGLDPRWRETEVIIASDVDNPLLGLIGATNVYGPQKGVTDDRLQAVDATLERLAAVTDKRLALAKGAGAAGGLGFGLMLLGGTRSPGIALVAEAVGLLERARRADLVVTGEGAFDF